MTKEETTTEQKRELLFPSAQKEIYKTKRIKVNAEKIYDKNINLRPSDNTIKEKEIIKRSKHLGDVSLLAKFSDCLTSEKSVHVIQNIPSIITPEPHNNLQFLSRFFFSAAPVTNTLSEHLNYNALVAADNPQKESEISIKPSARDKYKIKAFIDQNLIFLIFPNKRTIYVNKFKNINIYKGTKFIKKFTFDCKIFNVHKLTPSLFIVTSENRFYILKADLQSGFSADYKTKINILLPKDAKCRFKHIVQTESLVASFNENRIFFFQKPDLRFVQSIELQIPSLQSFKIKSIEYINNDTFLVINDINNIILVSKNEKGVFATVNTIYDNNLLDASCSLFDREASLLFIGTEMGKVNLYRITSDNDAIYLNTFFSKNLLGNPIKEILYDNASKIGIIYCNDKRNGGRQFILKSTRKENADEIICYDIQFGIIEGLNLYIRSVDMLKDNKSSNVRILIGTSKGFINIYTNNQKPT